MKKIYICAPNRYKERTRALAGKLQGAGFSVTFAAEHTNQDIESKAIFDSNMGLIRDADILLAYFVEDGHYGIDFASEVGQAAGIGKRVVGFVDLGEEQLDGFKRRLDKDVMFNHSIGPFAWRFEELLDILK
jgi:nucleoside 2-deoxyribosyltransferase